MAKEATRVDQAPSYSRLTVGSVTVPDGDGFRAGGWSNDMLGPFPNVGNPPTNFPDYTEEGFSPPDDYTNAPAVDRDELPESADRGPEIFVIAWHSVSDGADAVGSGDVGDPSSLIGLKVLKTGSYSNVDVPIFPVAGKSVLFEVGDEGYSGGKDQQFPPRGDEVRAAVYTDGLPGDSASDPAATATPSTVTDSLDQNGENFDERGPVGPDDFGF
jgi:hypothetical protein